MGKVEEQRRKNGKNDENMGKLSFKITLLPSKIDFSYFFDWCLRIFQKFLTPYFGKIFDAPPPDFGTVLRCGFYAVTQTLTTGDLLRRRRTTLRGERSPVDDVVPWTSPAMAIGGGRIRRFSVLLDIETWTKREMTLGSEWSRDGCGIV